jgi:hypothetical protein
MATKKYLITYKQDPSHLHPIGTSSLNENNISSWFPNHLLGNRVLVQDDCLIVSGTEAEYFKKLFANNPDLFGELTEVADLGATATATMLPVVSMSVVAGGSGYSVADDALTIVGGTFTEAAVAQVLTVGTVVGQDETTIVTFTGGSGHVVSDVITLDDGTTITVDAVNTGAVTEFTVTTGSTSGQGSDGATLSQTGTDGSGINFDMTLTTASQSVFSANATQVSETAVGRYSVLPTDPVSHTGGTGSGATFNMDWAVHSVTVTDGGVGYADVPVVSISGTATGTAVLTGDAVSSVVVTSPGSGYTATATVTIEAP